MTFRLHQAQYDSQTGRAYVEFRRGDGDGGEQLCRDYLNLERPVGVSVCHPTFKKH